MNLESMSREQLIEQIKEMNEYMDNVVVFWGGKKQFKDTFQDVAGNEAGEYSDEESANAKILSESEAAFNEFINLARESFERGGINYLLSEKVSDLMEEAASRHRGSH